MSEVRDKLNQLQLPTEAQAFVEQIMKQSEHDQVVVGFFGSFSVGKSELINNLIEHQGFLPTHTNETTAVVTTITSGAENKIDLIYKDGQVEATSIDQLHALVAGGNVSGIEKIAIALREPEWLKVVTLIDTPGRNTKYAAHIEASKQAIIDADAAVYVLPWQGLTAEDIVYLKDLVIYQSNLYFILNKVDRIEEAQGQTIEDVRKNVEQELAALLGKVFPVYALSAKTGFNLSVFKDEFIPQVTGNIIQLKQQRFLYAMNEFITRHAVTIENEIKMMELANLEGEQALRDQKRKIEVEQTKLQAHVDKELSILKEVLASLQVDTTGFIEATLRDSIKQIRMKLLDSLQIQQQEQLNNIVESQFLTARNKIYQRFADRLSEVMANKNLFKLSELDITDVNIQIQEPSLEDLKLRYEERLQEIETQFEQRKKRLEILLDQQQEPGMKSEMQELQQSLQELEEQLFKEYVPKYVDDVNFDPNKATKIFKAIGVAGDIAASIALAVATAGASAGAQAAGKAGAEVAKQTGKAVGKEVAEQAAKQVVKETGKAIGKEATEKAVQQVVKVSGKAVGKEVVEQAAKQIVKETAEEVAKQAGKETLKKVGLESLKVLSKLTSPVETAATAIGQAIDGGRKAEQVLDKEHRQKFFMKKQQIESQYHSKKNELQQLKEQQKSNATIVQNIELKLEQIERSKEEEFRKLEQAMKRDQAQLQKRKLEEMVKEQLEALQLSEQEKYNSWVKLEMDKAYLLLENTLPSYYDDQFSQLIEKMKSIEVDSNQNQGTITNRLAELQHALSICKELQLLMQHDD
ncbi:dynamin family protein [Schinkia sp. CFF1]